MAELMPGSTLTLADADSPLVPGREEGWTLRVGDEDRGRVRGHAVTLDDLDLEVQRTGERFELVTSTGTPVLRFDPAGRKATTLTLSSARYRLARQKPRPLLHRWRLTNDVHGHTVMEASHTPFGRRIKVDDDPGVDPAGLAILAVGVVVELLDIEPTARAA